MASRIENKCHPLANILSRVSIVCVCVCVCIILLVATLSNSVPLTQKQGRKKTARRTVYSSFVWLPLLKYWNALVILMRVCCNGIIIISTSCSIQMDAKCRHLDRMRPNKNQKYGQHLSIQIQNTLSELINWSSLLMVSKWFYIDFTLYAFIFIDYLLGSAWSVVGILHWR